MTAGPDETAQEAREVAEEFYPDAVEAEIAGDIVDGEIVEDSGDQAEIPAQDAEEPAQVTNEAGEGGESPPLAAYAEEPPPDLMDDFPGEEDTPPDPEPEPEPETQPKDKPTENGKSRSANKSKRRKI